MDMNEIHYYLSTIITLYRSRLGLLYYKTHTMVPLKDESVESRIPYEQRELLSTASGTRLSLQLSPYLTRPLTSKDAENAVSSLLSCFISGDDDESAKPS